MNGRVRATAAAVLVAFLLTVTAIAPAPASADAAAAESDFVGRINDARASRGIGQLRVDAELTSIARRWSQRMADDQRLSHNPNLSKEVTQDWEKLAENVGFGGDVATIHDAFMKSASHRANILDGALTHVGVGVVVDASGQLWVTEVFMRLRQSGTGGGTTATTAARPAPAPAPAPASAPTAAPTTARPRRAPAPTPPPTTAPPPAAAPVPDPATEAAAPAVDPTAAPAATPTARLVLVLDRLVALDRRR